jgi:hypothetical protein
VTTVAKTDRYALCVENRGHAAALEIRKIYRLIEDAAARVRGLVRIIDESGEDYLYPARFFVPIEVPREAAKAFAKKSA